MSGSGAPPVAVKALTPEEKNRAKFLRPAEIDGRVVVFRGQHQQDRFVHDVFFAGRHGGTFLECGALDGLYLSNTQVFEAFFGWRGVLVEPLARPYEALVANRPNARCLNACVGPKEETVLFLNHKNGGLSGIVKEVGRLHIEKLEHSYAVNPASYQRPEPLLTLEWKPVIRTTRAIREAGFDHLDLFSLDVEGGEAAVLAGLDLTEVTVDVFCVEVKQPGPGDVAGWMEANGFRPIARLAEDVIYAHSRFLAALAERGVDVDARMAATTVPHLRPDG